MITMDVKNAHVVVIQVSHSNTMGLKILVCGSPRDENYYFKGKKQISNNITLYSSPESSFK